MHALVALHVFSFCGKARNLWEWFAVSLLFLEMFEKNFRIRTEL